MRWGYKNAGMFSVKEAYIIYSETQNLVLEPFCSNLWSLQLWPKIGIFTWILVRRHILPWENVTKRGFVGPSWCCMCGSSHESIDHLFDEYPLANQLWERIEQGFYKHDRVVNNIM